MTWCSMLQGPEHQDLKKANASKADENGLTKIPLQHFLLCLEGMSYCAISDICTRRLGVAPRNRTLSAANKAVIKML